MKFHPGTCGAAAWAADRGCDVDRAEDEGERDPGARDAREHRVAVLEHGRHDKGVHDQREAEEGGGGPQRRRVRVAARVGAGRGAEGDGHHEGVDHERVVERRHLPADHHHRAADRPGDRREAQRRRRAGRPARKTISSRC